MRMTLLCCLMPLPASCQKWSELGCVCVCVSITSALGSWRWIDTAACQCSQIKTHQAIPSTDLWPDQPLSPVIGKTQAVEEGRSSWGLKMFHFEASAMMTIIFPLSQRPSSCPYPHMLCFEQDSIKSLVTDHSSCLQKGNSFPFT